MDGKARVVAPVYATNGEVEVVARPSREPEQFNFARGRLLVRCGACEREPRISLYALPSLE